MRAFTDLINLPQLTTGRVIFALKGFPDEARAVPAIAAAVAGVEQAAVALKAIEHDWVLSKTRSNARGKAAALDVEIDRAIGAIATLARGYVSGLGADDPVHKAAARVLARALPQGAGAITRLVYEEELDAGLVLVARLRGELAEEAAQIGLEPVIAALEGLLPRFEAELKKSAVKVDFSQVRAARDTLHQAVAVLVVQVLAHHATPDQAEARAAALKPILFQAGEVAALRRRRRRVTDVDPETGVEIDPDGVQADA